MLSKPVSSYGKLKRKATTTKYIEHVPNGYYCKYVSGKVFFYVTSEFFLHFGTNIQELEKFFPIAITLDFIHIVQLCAV